MTAFFKFFTGLGQMDFLVAFRNLLQHTRRTLFLGAAIAAVTAITVLLTGLSTGTSEMMLRSATTLMTGHVNVGGFYKITEGTAAPVVTNYQDVLKVVKSSVPELDYVTARGRGWTKIISDTSSIQCGVAGIDIGAEPGFKSAVEVISGKLEDLEKPNTILIFEGQAKKLDVKVGDMLTLSAPTTRGTNNTGDVRVVAIVRDLGLLSGFNVFIQADALRALYQLAPSATGALMLHLKPEAIDRSSEIVARLRKDLGAAGYKIMDADPHPFFMKFDKVTREAWTGQKLDVTSWEDELAFFSWTLQAIQGLSALVLTILLAIIVIGIMNTMWIAIRERTREIGTLRAIGMQREQVVRQFLLEAIMLGVLSTLLGALLGGLAGLLINRAQLPVPIAGQIFLLSSHFFISLHPSDLAGAVAAITCVTGLAALYPSLRAAKLQPVSAMSHFG
jgi:ABC-type lipoprotein release transport system permease subunit